MSTNPNNSQLDSRTRLAHALGFDSYPSDSSVEPYLTYITNQHVGGESLDEWLELFIQVIQHFKLNAGNVNGPTAGDSIRLLIGGLALAGFGQLFADTNTGDPPRKTQVEDKVMYILGTWAMMRNSFQHRAPVACNHFCIQRLCRAPQPTEKALRRKPGWADLRQWASSWRSTRS